MGRFHKDPRLGWREPPNRLPVVYDPRDLWVSIPTRQVEVPARRVGKTLLTDRLIAAARAAGRAVFFPKPRR